MAAISERQCPVTQYIYLMSGSGVVGFRWPSKGRQTQCFQIEFQALQGEGRREHVRENKQTDAILNFKSGFAPAHYCNSRAPIWPKIQ